MAFEYKIYSLGDSTLTIDYGNQINLELNKEVISRFHQLQSLQLPWIKDLIPAYSSLTIHYDMMQLVKNIQSQQTIFAWVKNFVEEKLKQDYDHQASENELIRIPVCYDPEYAPDMDHICSLKNITREELIKEHTSNTYRIYMLGFLPGFAYMGEVNDTIAVPRKQKPVQVHAGSVGIAGKQTGVYPLDSPGGWQIIGRTPMKLFDVSRDEPVMLRAGMSVQFYDEKSVSPEVRESVSPLDRGAKEDDRYIKKQ